MSEPGGVNASDLTDAEWRLIEPFMPPVRRLGRPRETDLRAVIDAILYIARTGYTDEETLALLNLLVETIEADRYPYSPRIRVLRAIQEI